MSQQPFMNAPVATQQRNTTAVASLTLGILSFSGLIIPILGVVLSIIGIVLSINARNSSTRRGMVTAGMVVSVVGLILSIANWILGVYILTHR